MISLAAADFELPLSRVRTVLQSLAAELPVVGAYLSGSVAANLANSASDIDIVAVLRDGEKPAGGGSITVEGLAEDVWGDLRFVTTSDLEGMVELFSERLPSSADLWTRVGTLEGHIGLMSRFAHARILFDPQGTLEASQVRVRASAARDNYVAVFVARGINAFRDVVGARDASDWSTALLAANELVGMAAEAFLGSQDDVYCSRKFWLTRLGRLPETTLAEHIKELMFPVSDRWEDGTRVAACQGAAIRLVAAAQFGTPADLPIADGKVGKFGWTTEYLPVRLSDGARLCGATREVALTGAETKVWEWACGRTEPELIELATASSSVDRQRLRRWLRRTVDSFVDRGILERRGTNEVGGRG